MQRTFELATRSKGGAIEMAISSELPVERIFGNEVLLHSPDAIDLSRLNDGRHPLLLNHDPSDQVGVMESVSLGGDRILRGKPRFSQSTKGKEIKQDVVDGIRTLVSVGYEILNVTEERTVNGELVARQLTGEQFEREMREKYGDTFYRAGAAACRAQGENVPTYKVTRWRPFEVSIVSIPADPSVGVGRSVSMNNYRRNQNMEHEDINTSREKTIALLGENYSRWLKPDDVTNAIKNDMPAEAFRELIIKRMETKHTDTSGQYIDMPKHDAQRYSLARAITAQLTGDWSKAGLEREASESVARMVGKSPVGFYVPFDIFRRDFNVGTTTEAGNLVATDFRGDMFTDVLRNNLVMGPLGVRILAGLSGNVDIPKKTSASSLAMVSEIGSASETNPLTDKVSLSPKRISGFIEYSRQALIQSGIALESMLREDLLNSAAVLLQDQVINGSGSGNNMTGLRNVTGIGTVVGGANGAALAWSHIVNLESACADNNAEPGVLSGYLINSKTRGKLKQTQMGTNLPFIWQNTDKPLNGYRVGVTNTVPSNLTKGTSTTVCSSVIYGSDWSMAVIGLFGAPDIVVDPYSKADTGQIKITLNHYADFGVRLPECFASMEDALTT